MSNYSFAQSTFNYKNWWMLSAQDSIPGTNFFNAVNLISSKKVPKQQITIAVLDTDIAINHKKFKEYLWKNSKEIIGDSIDNDKNGYVDDMNGWNFLGQKKDGSSLNFVLMEEARILGKYNKEQFNKVKKKKRLLFSYDSVKKSYDDLLKPINEDIQSYIEIEPTYTFVIDTLKKIYKKSNIDKKTLNSFTSKDENVGKYIAYAKDLYGQGFPYDEFMDYLNGKKVLIDICLSLEHDNRDLIGDNYEEIKDVNYGSPLLNTITTKIEHGTEVSGVIVNSLDYIKEKNKSKAPINIMPICMTAIGDPTDKDTALAIRYAVDNGAKVINLSQTKTFSLNDKWVDKALCYAQENDVLIVKSAGNDKLDLDHKLRFPNDTDSRGKEIVDNLIVVGGVTISKKDSKNHILYKNSNYGKENVDVFAPARKISTFSPSNNYTESSGTSYSAPIVATVAALIRSYYPSLSAKQVKQILMDSGTNYKVEIPFKQKDGSEKRIPFSDLSKSGKVINAYNAFIMAEKMTKR